MRRQVSSAERPAALLSRSLCLAKTCSLLERISQRNEIKYEDWARTIRASLLHVAIQHLDKRLKGISCKLLNTVVNAESFRANLEC